MSASRATKTRNGLATLKPEAVVLMDLLERRFLSWAGERDAECWIYPPLMAVADLERLDYFRNFPHLGLIVSHVRSEHLLDVGQKGVTRIPESHLVSSEFALPSAACYNVYLDLQNTTLQNARCVTTVAHCFRNEGHYDGLARLLGFTMREVVCVGSSEQVRAHLDWFRSRILAFAVTIDLPLEVRPAIDPFYDASGSRSMMQKLATVKEEFVYDGSIAVASINTHRNFFGERCNIRLADNSFAFSGCAAFGLERWIYALTRRFDEDFEQAQRALGT